MTELPTFDWITEPQEVPEALKKLEPGQDVVCVICRDPRRRSHLTHEATAQEHIAEIESLMSRQAMGRYTIAEVATILAKENHLDEMKLLARLKETANDKKLAVTDPDTGGTPIAPNAQPLVFSHWVSPDSVNALLKEWGVCYRFAWPRPWRLVPSRHVPAWDVAVTTPAPVESTATPAPVVQVPTQGNSTKMPRSDTITPVIKMAQDKCTNRTDTSQVWAQMQVLAQNETAPFLASTNDGLKYHKKGKDAYFTRDALNKRLHPKKRGGPGKRR